MAKAIPTSIIISIHDSGDQLTLTTNQQSPHSMQIIEAPGDHPQREQRKAELIEVAISYLKNIQRGRPLYWTPTAEDVRNGRV